MPPDTKEIVKLTPRNYLGRGYYHWFRNNETNEVVAVECTQEEYEALGLPNAGPAVLEGHTWLYSGGGTAKVDTPSGFLGEKEYTIIEDKKLVVVDGKEQFVLSKDVDGEHNLDTSKLEKK